MITPPPIGLRGIVIERFLSCFLSFFVYLFRCQQHYEKTSGPICMKFSGKVWSDHGTTWFNFGSIRVKGSAGRRSSCLLSPAIAIWFDCGLLAVVCCHLATENVMKLLFLAFRYVAPGGGVCCAPHHSLFYISCVLFLIVLYWYLIVFILCIHVSCTTMTVLVTVLVVLLLLNLIWFDLKYSH